MENLLILLLILCTITIYICHKTDLEPFQVGSGEPELQAFQENKRLFEEKIRELDNAMNRSPRSVKMNDNIVQNYKLELDKINRLENEQITSSNIYNQNIIDNLQNKLETLEKIIGSGNNTNDVIKGVQSLQDGLKLNVKSNSSGNNKYQIMLNDGCLDVKTANKYFINKCDPNKDTQNFDIRYINNDAFYNSTLEYGLDKVQKDDNIQYPFHVIKSSNTDNCLQNNFGYLSLEPCVVRKGQRWKELSGENKCVV